MKVPLGVAELTVKVNAHRFKIEMERAKAHAKRFGAAAESAFQDAQQGARDLTSAVFSVKGAVAGLVGGYTLTRISDSLLDAARSAERLQASLDTITKGMGQETFDALNRWAKDMPVDTDQAIETFKMLRAMGLEPTIKDMTILVDTISALGGGAPVLEGISRAIGQIATKNKVLMEEMLQLAERKVPVFEILREEMGLTSAQLGDIAKAGLDVDQTLKAMMTGLEKRYGGASARMMETWDGMILNMKSTSLEFRRAIMKSGPFEAMKVSLKSYLDYLATNEGQMNLQKWAQDTAVVIMDSFLMMTKGLKVFLSGLKNLQGLYAGFVSGLKQIQLKGLEEQIKGNRWLLDNGFWSEKRLNREKELLAQRDVIKSQIDHWDNLGVSAVSSAMKIDQAISGLTKKIEEFKRNIKPVKLFAGGDVLGGVGIGGDKNGGAGKKTPGAALVKNKYAIDPEVLDRYWQDYENRQVQAISDAAASSRDAHKNLIDQLTQDWDTAFSGWANSYAATLNDMMWESEFSFSRIAESFARMATQMIIQQELVRPFVGAMTGEKGLISKGFNFLASVLHGGGVVGSGDGGTRATSSLAFSGAPRFHQGLMPDEFPAILQRGETVFTRAQTQALGHMIGRGATPPNIQITIENKTGADLSASQEGPKWDGEKWIIGTVLKALNNNTGNFRANMKAGLA